MKKLFKITAVLALAALLLAGSAAFVLLNLGRIIQRAVNTYGPEAMKTEVRVADVDIAILKAQAKLTDLYIGNPSGFSSQKLFSAHTVVISLSRRSVLGSPLVIDRLEIDGPEIVYEKKGHTDNFKTLLKNMAQPAAGQPDNASRASSHKGRQQGRKLIIRELVIRNAKVTAGFALVGGKSMAIDLAELRLHNIGGASGVVPAEAVRQLLAGMYEKISANSGLASKINDAAGSSSQSNEDGGKKGVNRAAEAIKKLFGK